MTRHDRYAAMFAACRSEGRGAFVPFWMLGDPTPERMLAIVAQLIAAGADALELGIPCSDPVADGPVIQAAAVRAIAAGTTLRSALALVAAVRERHPDLPLGLLGYLNLVAHVGPERFYDTCAAAGVDSVLIADLPVVEAAPYAAAALHRGIAPVLVAPQNASAATLDGIARLARGYVYLSGRAGVTGNHAAMRAPAAELIAGLAKRGAAPPLIGFGVGTPEHVRTARHAGGAGVIVGSALVGLMADHEASGTLELALASRCRALRAAC